jgi:hypothetical protein
MAFDHSRVYDSSEDFFALDGSCVMMLTTKAAIESCERAAECGFLVARVEGGIWRNPGFEARLDCIWDGLNPPVDRDTAEENNHIAAVFILSESAVHDVFVLTAPPITGWKSKIKPFTISLNKVTRH